MKVGKDLRLPETPWPVLVPGPLVAAPVLQGHAVLTGHVAVLFQAPETVKTETQTQRHFPY